MKNRRFSAGIESRSIILLVVLAILSACGSKSVPVSELSPEDLWTRGIEAYNDEDWEDAIRYFDRYALVAGTDPRAYQARYYSANARFERKEYVTAASDFSRLSSDLGTTDLADDARFMACRAYDELSPKAQLDQEYTLAAIDHCRALIDYFPDSEFVPRAQAIVERMVGKLAQKIYENGDWYFGRRAYDSAIIYFEDVVEQYPGTAWAPRALLRLVEIYGILEWSEERDEMRQRLLREYPESDAARELPGGTGADAT